MFSAASVNPLDTYMINGYGQELLGRLKQLEECDLSQERYPLIPGRDCAAVVEAVGGGVHNLTVGDEVIALAAPHRQGSHAEYLVTDASMCSAWPKNLSAVQAASLPYVANTAWSALVTVARLNPKGGNTSRVLINGGSGGVGTVAIQMLKAWGVPKIVVTCSEESFELVKSLGAIPVSYKSADVKDQLTELGPFEVIFDCVDTDISRWSGKLLGVWRNSVHVTIVSPLMRETDRHGTIPGLFTTAANYFDRSLEYFTHGRFFSYAFFLPSSDCMRQISSFAQENKLKPIVESTYKFEDLPKAFEKVVQLHGKGKTVIEVA
ncbi:unnamed protein product [Auanema sp. JU1783]|nr:unnamed protein product [Auanema sp. JU1783]